MVGQNLVDQIGGALVHAPPQTTRTEPPPLATEGHQVPLAARLAMHLREAMGQDAAFQKTAQLFHDEFRQAISGIRVHPHPLEGG
jgi:hypothetical protein